MSGTNGRLTFLAGFKRRFHEMVLWGAGYAALGLVIGMMRLAQGDHFTVANATKLLLVGAGYYLMAVTTASVVVASIGRWATTRLRGALVGAVATTPGMLILGAALYTMPLLKLVVMSVALGIVMGAPLGAMYWRRAAGAG